MSTYPYIEMCGGSYCKATKRKKREIKIKI